MLRSVSDHVQTIWCNPTWRKCASCTNTQTRFACVRGTCGLGLHGRTIYIIIIYNNKAVRVRETWRRRSIEIRTSTITRFGRNRAAFNTKRTGLTRRTVEWASFGLRIINYTITRTAITTTGNIHFWNSIAIVYTLQYYYFADRYILYAERSTVL